MIVVLDTSAAVELVLQKKRALDISRQLGEAEWVVVPDLYCSEITNVFWKYSQFSDLTVEQCEAALNKAMLLPDDFVSCKDLYLEAYAMGCLEKGTAYDMFFLVLARRHNAVLLTIDKKLKTHAKRQAVRVLPL